MKRGTKPLESERTEEMTTTLKQATQITAAAIYRVTDKVTGTKFFLVKSDSCKNCYHEVRWSDELAAWQCNGEHCIYQRGGTNCKHARAASEVMQARRAASVRLQAAEERAAANLASVAIAERPIEERGQLNNRNSGFSLMRR
jgi:hypothetical protein